MDKWIAFFKDNPVLVGALIATIPLLISNAVQIILHISDAREKRREAKIQAKEKWTERDVLQIMDTVENMIKMFAEIRKIGLETDSLLEELENPLFTHEDIRKKAKENSQRLQEVYYETNKTFDMLSRLVFSFEEDDIHSSYEKFMKSVIEFMDKTIALNKSPDSDDVLIKDESNTWSAVKINAGYFHKTLRDKLISLRK